MNDESFCRDTALPCILKAGHDGYIGSCFNICIFKYHIGITAPQFKDRFLALFTGKRGYPVPGIIASGKGYALHSRVFYHGFGLVVVYKQVLENTFTRQDYAFGLPPSSPHRETLNQAMLEVIGTDAWQDLLRTYLGE